MSDDHPVEAINHVLRAEADSREAVEACRQQAMETVENSRDKARRIINRIDDRISSLHARSDRSVNERLSQIRQEIADLSHLSELDDDAHARLELAVKLLLDEMVGTHT
jgi:vacuolar-type H+-ATPase subunit H